MENFIYENESLSENTCDEIIKMFELQIEKNNCKNKNKCMSEILIRSDIKEDNIWFSIKNTLTMEIQRHLQNYYSKLNNDIYFFDLIQKNKTIQNFVIQKYNKNMGNPKYHHDFYADFKNKKTRIINFIWFLNTVDDGGETIFLDCHIVKSEKGKIVFFPTDWFFPYYINSPLSDDKYIITGWIYIDI